MNREIKFRIKNNWDGNWEYFPPIYSESWSADLQSCDSKTLSQFTGLNDKSGKEIYEGDIIQWFDTTDISSTPKSFKGEVHYMVEGARFIIRFTDVLGKRRFKEFNATYGDGDTFMQENIEVIGNIYENPERLKQTA